MELVLPFNIQNNTPADATQVDGNYDYIADFVNGQLINRDGRISMDAQLLLVGDPTERDHAANKNYVDALLPIGIIMPYGGVAAPAGKWLLCDGTGKSVSTYKDLHNVLGFRYGGSGGTFNLPNMAGRVPVGVDTARTIMSATGKSGGTYAVPIAAHSHPMPHTHPMAHTHEHPHTHSIAHNHGSLNTALAGNHNHDISVIVDQEVSGPVSGARPVAYAAGGTHITTAGEASHAHAVDLPNYTGNSGAVSEATTSAASSSTTGAVSTTNTSTAGTANAEHIPPFVVVQYIIRAL
jgi:microcystin-dependent protein